MKSNSVMQWLLCLSVVSFGIFGCGNDEDAHQPEPGAIAGVVTLEAVGPAQGVLVDIVDSRLETETAEDGSFSFVGLASRTFVLEISHPGHVTETIEVETVRGETIQVDVELQQVNEPPSIVEVVLDPPVFEPGGTATVTVTATDPNPDTLSYTFETPEGYGVSETEGNTATITAPGDFDVEGQLTVVVTDDDGEQARREVRLVTVDNTAPVVEGVVALPSVLQPGQTAEVRVSASDADGDELSYQWEVPADWSIDDASASTAQITAPAAFEQSALVRVTVRDAYDVPARGQVVLQTAENRPPQVTSVTATPPQVAPESDITLSASASDPENGPLTYQWTAPSGWVLGDASSATTTLTAPSDYGVSESVSLTVTDDAGAFVETSIVVSTTSNNAPVISSLTATPNSVARGGSIQLDVSAADPNSDGLTYNWTAPTSWTLSDATIQSPTLSAPTQSGQVASITVTVTDSSGLSATGSTVVSTTSNRAPVLSSLSALPQQVAPGGTITVDALATDADGDGLTFTWSVPAEWTLSGSGATVSLTAPSTYSSAALIQLTVEDGFGGSATGQTTVSTERNDTPVITSLTADDNPMRRAEVTTLRAAATDANGDALSYAWTVSDASWTITPDSIDASMAALQAPDAPDAAATVTLTVEDAAGASATSNLRVSTSSNNAPVIANLTADDNPLSRGTSTLLNASVSDPDGDPLTYTWNVSDTAWTITPDANGAPSATMQAPNTPGVSATVTLTATDDVGGSTTATLRMSTKANNAPVISSVTAADNPLARNTSTTLSSSAFEPDGDPLTYTWSLDNSAWSYTGSGSQITLQSPDIPSSTVQVTVTVADDAGAQTTANLTVSTEPNDTPEIISTPPAESPVASGRKLWSYQVLVEDSDDATLTYSLQGAGATSTTIDTTTGLIEWTPLREERGSYSFTIEVSDGWEIARQQFSLVVEPFRLQQSNVYSGLYVYGYPRVADLDGDGLADPFNSKGDVTDTTALAILRSANGYNADKVEPTSVDAGNCRGVAAGEIDGNPGLDVVFACSYQPSYGNRAHIVTWLNGIDQSTQAGSFSLGSIYSASTTAGYQMQQIELADLNGDGHLDVVGISNHQHYVHTWLGDGAGGFSAHQSFATPRFGNHSNDYNRITDMQLVDMDADGTPELVLSEQDVYDGMWSHRVRVYDVAASGMVGTSPLVAFDTGMEHGAQQMLAVDFNADSFPDIFVSDINSTTEYFENDGTGNLMTTGQTLASCGSDMGYQGMDAGDIDMDGKMDIVVANRCNDSVVLAFGDSTGAFDEVITLATTNNSLNNTYTVALGDYDADGANDLFVLDYFYTNSLSIRY